MLHSKLFLPPSYLTFFCHSNFPVRGVHSLTDYGFFQDLRQISFYIRDGQTCTMGSKNIKRGWHRSKWVKHFSDPPYWKKTVMAYVPKMLSFQMKMKQSVTTKYVFFFEAPKYSALNRNDVANTTLRS